MIARFTLVVTTLCVTLAANAQNDCATAIPITVGTYVVDTVDGAQIPLPVCATGGNTATNGEWYTYTPSEDRSLTVTTDLPENLDLDTRFHVYTGTCGNLVCYDGDDDAGSGYLSYALFNVLAGVTYTIAFDDRWDADGFTFQLIEGEPFLEAVTFTTQSLSTQGSVRAIVDMDSDGLDDVVSVTTSNININYQLAGGGFNTVNLPNDTVANSPSWSLCAGDLDGNGRMDLLYGGGSGVTLMFANENSTAFSDSSYAQYVFCQRTNMVDINNDGHLDAFLCHDVAPNVYLMNDGEGQFIWNQGGLGDTQGGGNYGSIWTDFDNDGDQDMFIAKCRGGNPVVSTNQLHRNNGDGTFTEVAALFNLADPMQTWSSAWGDFDNDGDMDALVGASSFAAGGHKLMRNDGTTFTDITAGSGWDEFLGTSIEHITHDFNNDGWLDVMSGSGTIMINQGGMVFEANPVGFDVGAVGDLNDDGALDLMNSSTARINNGNSNNWLRIRTVGTVSNPNGIGARIILTTASGQQIRDVRSGDGFRYMSTITAHFGLGTDEEVLQVEVRWPSGIVNVLTDVDINTTMTIVEEISTDVRESILSEVLVYPVPANDVIQVTGSGVTQAPVRVFNAAGGLVLQGTLSGERLDVSTLSSGFYLLEVGTAAGAVRRSFTKH
ncbi:MAG: VCBS repeat-containing protein [Flavobacteriales bacterium]|nr:VCBS repeat-containing protein [Flavobacteriales bacterium]MBP7448810.1 VCBS repeat-containing protein [Flavobacteriales bacterium]